MYNAKEFAHKTNKNVGVYIILFFFKKITWSFISNQYHCWITANCSILESTYSQETSVWFLQGWRQQSKHYLSHTLNTLFLKGEKTISTIIFTFKKSEISHLLPFPFFLLFTTVDLWLRFCFFDELPPPWASFTLFWPVQALMGKRNY